MQTEPHPPFLPFVLVIPRVHAQGITDGFSNHGTEAFLECRM
jgi:hypothetical protein